MVNINAASIYLLRLYLQLDYMMMLGEEGTLRCFSNRG